ncbi:hypothetical protein SANT12839_021260 [Streptomyces antimycoticus]|uniref:PFL domain-containing protein n=1 Tax=Streptomyces antimycoticus TaxID=68175 RepID=A0A4D4JZ89_9ACTN|nr:hypothetical protein SANT12839_021260 [Streptomyces antimycoticus]
MTVTVTDGHRAATEAWRGFSGTRWRGQVDVRDFIQANYTPYDGDSTFLAGPTERTLAVWGKVAAPFPEERRRGVYDVDTATPSTIISHAPGFIDRDRELIVGLQTDPQLRHPPGPARRSGVDPLCPRARLDRRLVGRRRARRVPRRSGQPRPGGHPAVPQAGRP